MKKRGSFFYHITVFVVSQLAWLALLGIWIYWYVSNYIIFKNVGEKLSPGIIYNGTKVFPFVGGIVLLVSIAFGMSLIFRHLNVQLRLNKLYDNFIANITHELKSPLSSIQLYLETLNSRPVPAEKQKEFINMMMKDAGRLKNLINSILEISALEQKKIVHDYQIYPVDRLLQDLIQGVIEQFNLPQNSIKIEGRVDCECMVDKNAIKIVLNNLTDNAIKYSIKPIRICIKLKTLFSKVVIDFSDNGIGIPSSELKNIFSKFYRIYGANIPNVKGTGLGLYSVKEIIRSHGGKITALSEGIDMGSTFRIELPVYNEFIRKFKKSFPVNIKKKELIEKTENNI
ncbi:MAG: HAMP domain-containing sensor histidine kinase [Ignavibacteriaceae bacterium]|jgi:signal transduction histidine kinase